MVSCITPPFTDDCILFVCRCYCIQLLLESTIRTGNVYSIDMSRQIVQKWYLSDKLDVACPGSLGCGGVELAVGEAAEVVKWRPIYDTAIVTVSGHETRTGLLG